MASRTENFIVEKSLPSERLDRFLGDRFPAASRGALQRLIEEGHIRVNGQTVKPTHHPRAGESEFDAANREAGRGPVAKARGRVPKYLRAVIYSGQFHPRMESFDCASRRHGDRS